MAITYSKDIYPKDRESQGIHMPASGEDTSRCGMVIEYGRSDPAFRPWSPRARAWTDDPEEATCQKCIASYKRWASIREAM